MKVVISRSDGGPYKVTVTLPDGTIVVREVEGGEATAITYARGISDGWNFARQALPWANIETQG